MIYTEFFSIYTAHAYTSPLLKGVAHGATGTVTGAEPKAAPAAAKGGSKLCLKVEISVGEQVLVICTW